MAEEFDEIHVEPLSEKRSRAAAAARMRDQTSYVDAVIRDAQARGEFDHLAGAGQPIQDLGEQHDPDWWLKRLVEREQIAVLPPSIQLRKDDAALDDLLDTQRSEDEARAVVEEFNARVIKARYSIPVGPPLITMTRDIEATLAGWRERHAAAGPSRKPDEPAASAPRGARAFHGAVRIPVLRRLLGRRARG